MTHKITQQKISNIVAKMANYAKSDNADIRALAEDERDHAIELVLDYYKQVMAQGKAK